MFLVDVFNDQYLELPGQEHNGHHRQKDQGEPVGISAWQHFKLHQP